MTLCLIGIGSNVGDRLKTVQHAASRLADHPQIDLVAVSSWHETQPIGGPPGQSSFLNGAAIVKTILAPQGLLNELHSIESDLGRVRAQRWDPRTVDLDLLMHGDRIIDLPDLRVPHPWMALRRFVLTPASEIAGAWVHPVLDTTIAKLLDLLDRRPIHVAIVGTSAEQRARRVRGIADRLRTDHQIRSTIVRSIAATEEARSAQAAWELIERNCRALQQALAGTRSVCLSEYWIGEPLVSLERSEGREALHTLWTDWRQLPGCIRRPHLLIDMQWSDHAASDGSRVITQQTEDAQNLLPRSLVFETSRPPLLPLPLVENMDHCVVSDAIAAILAMM